LSIQVHYWSDLDHCSPERGGTPLELAAGTAALRTEARRPRWRHHVIVYRNLAVERIRSAIVKTAPQLSII
jgi:hypothetical protein